VEEWIDQFANALGQDPVDPKEMGALLKLARDVAHGVDRRLAPLSTFVAGVHVGRRMAEGSSRQVALGEAIEAAGARIPKQPSAD
jgi:hypothetical protein